MTETLSDKRLRHCDSCNIYGYPEENVKKFIKDLKDAKLKNGVLLDADIDKLAGEELTK